MNYKNNNIWLYTFSKMANITATRSTNNAAKTKTQGMLGSTTKTPNLSQRDKDIRSMSTMDYMKKYHPEQKKQTTTTNQDGSVVSRSEDNKGNFVQVTTPTTQKKTNWYDAYKNNPEKVNEAKTKMEQQKFDLDDLNDEVADIESQMTELGNSPGDMFQKKMLGIKLYDAKQRQRTAQDAYNKMQRGWRSLERRGYTAYLNKMQATGSTPESTSPVIAKDNNKQTTIPTTTPSSATRTPTNVTPKLNNQPTMDNADKESGISNMTPISSQKQDNVKEFTDINPDILSINSKNSFLDFVRKHRDLKEWGWDRNKKITPSDLYYSQIPYYDF